MYIELLCVYKVLYRSGRSWHLDMQVISYLSSSSIFELALSTHSYYHSLIMKQKLDLE